MDEEGKKDSGAVSVLCPYCKDPLDGSRRVAPCNRCNTLQHVDCFKTHGRCAVYRCKGTLESVGQSKAVWALVACVVLLFLGGSGILLGIVYDYYQQRKKPELVVEQTPAQPQTVRPIPLPKLPKIEIKPAPLEIEAGLQPVATIALNAVVGRMILTQDQKTIYILNTSDAMIHRIDVKSHEETGRVQLTH